MLQRRKQATAAQNDSGRQKQIRGLLTICLIAEALGILVLSLLPELPQPRLQIPLLDKIAHLLAYFVLSGTAVLLFWWKAKNPWLMAGIIVVCCTLYGGAIELLQSFTGRSTELADLLADLAGAAAGGILASLLAGWLSRFRQQPGAGQ